MANKQTKSLTKASSFPSSAQGCAASFFTPVSGRLKTPMSAAMSAAMSTMDKLDQGSTYEKYYTSAESLDDMVEKVKSLGLAGKVHTSEN